MRLESLIVNYESWIRLGIFTVVFALVAICQVFSPKRRLKLKLFFRWRNNLSLLAINAVVMKLLLPSAAVGMALIAKQAHYGLFNVLALPQCLSIICSIVLLDLVIYLQHIVFHFVPFLWRIHRVHHADLDYDLTTGLRFHTFEIILSMFIKCLAIFIIGVPITAVIIFEVLLNGLAMFNHGNIHINSKADKYLRKLIVTPDFHRVHHSIDLKESNRNFGFNLSCWDYLFGTYKSAPKLGQHDMTIGLHQYRKPNQTNQLWSMFIMPFKK